MGGALLSAKFLESIQPLLISGQIACILFQFPWSFRYSPDALDYLGSLRDRFSDDVPVVFEFRHRSWLREKAMVFLESHEIGYVCVDEPRGSGLMPPVTAATADTGYIRFHSRDHSKWWGTDVKQRYNYLYSAKELQEWIPRIEAIRKRTKSLYIFFNNCHCGKAVKNALMMGDIMSSEKTGTEPAEREKP